MTNSMYDKIGGEAGCRRLVEAFYARLPDEPALVAVYPKHLRCAIEALTWYLDELTGGPPEHSGHTFHDSLRESHRRFQIGIEQRDAWLRNMAHALADTVADTESRDDLQRFFEVATAYLVNSPSLDSPSLPTTRGSNQKGGNADLWAVPQVMEEIVAAARVGDVKRTVALFDTPQMRAHLAANREAHARLILAVVAGDDERLLPWNEARLDAEPALHATTLRRGQTLLGGPAMSGALRFAEMLIRRGARADVPDNAGHCPLYHVGNGANDSGALVPILVGAEADVNANGGLMRCTALHMAARRGHVTVATALLDAGADIDARDSRGVTPLGRARNCRKPAVAALLIERGATG